MFANQKQDVTIGFKSYADSGIIFGKAKRAIHIAAEGSNLLPAKIGGKHDIPILGKIVLLGKNKRLFAFRPFTGKRTSFRCFPITPERGIFRIFWDIIIN